MYENSENLKICQDAKYGCRFDANPCCRYSKNLKREKPCGNFDCLYWSADYWSWQKPGLSRYVLAMCIQFSFYVFILFSIETSLMSKFYNKKQYLKLNETLKSTDKEKDVLKEEKRIQKLIKNNLMDTLTVNKLSKLYSDFQAVKEISFGVNLHECFCLLGFPFFLIKKNLLLIHD